MIHYTLPDDTDVDIKWHDKDPNIRPAQEPTSGILLPAWVRFNRSKWFKSQNEETSEQAYIYKILEQCFTREDVLVLFDVRDKDAKRPQTLLVTVFNHKDDGDAPA